MTATVLAPTSRAVPAALPQFVTLVGRAVVDRWRSLFFWGLGLVAMGVLQLAVYPSVASSAEAMQEFINQFPEGLRQAFQLEVYATGSGYLNAELFSLIVPFVLIAVAVGGAAAATAGEEERGTADVLFSLPVSRSLVLLAKAAAIVVGVVLLAALIALVLIVGAPIVDLDVPAAGIGAGTAMVTAMALMFAGFGLLIGALTGNRAAVVGTGIGLALAAFLLNILAPMADWLEPWQKASPFHWALADNPLATGMDWPMATLFVGLAAGFLLAAGWVFARRDIASR